MEPMELNGYANGTQKTSIYWFYSELYWLYSQLHWALLNSIANSGL
ncbi:718_t:CDS:1, partial [Scutellospora calospora]